MKFNTIENNIADALEFLRKQNSPVGCMLIHDDKKSLFFNIGKTHCEEIICRQFDCLEGYSIFLTLEPCIACVFLLCRKKISNIFFGAYNLEHGALGGKINFFEIFKTNHIPNYWGGFLIEECEMFLKIFFQKKRYIS